MRKRYNTNLYKEGSDEENKLELFKNKFLQLIYYFLSGY